jgi:AmiR/NasT family two-component response regulator
MPVKVLIVEDEILVAINLEALIEDLGYQCVGIAPDAPMASRLAGEHPDVALVDINLRDGPTGVQIGQMLSRLGASVLYVTANPRMLGEGVPGTLGVMEKPCDCKSVEEALDYAVQRRRGIAVPPPSYVTPFDEHRA